MLSHYKNKSIIDNICEIAEDGLYRITQIHYIIRNYSCYMCGSILENILYLADHVVGGITNEFSESPTPARKSLYRITQIHDIIRNYSCYMCGSVLENILYLADHIIDGITNEFTESPTPAKKSIA